MDRRETPVATIIVFALAAAGGVFYWWQIR